MIKLIVLLTAALGLSGCFDPPPPAACTCLIYPFPQTCSSECIAGEGVVESIGAGSVTVATGSANPASPKEHEKAKSIPLTRRTVSSKLVKPGLQVGSRVRVLYKRSANGQLEVQSITPS